MPCRRLSPLGSPNRWRPASIRSPARCWRAGRRRLGALILSDRTEPGDPANVAEALANAVAAQDLRPLPWTDAARQLQARVALMRGIEPDGGWPDLTRCGAENLDPGLAGAAPRRHHAAGRSRRSSTCTRSCAAGCPGSSHRAWISELPSHLNLPDGPSGDRLYRGAAAGLGQGAGVLWHGGDADDWPAAASRSDWRFCPPPDGRSR